jgi:hypothetical protein
MQPTEPGAAEQAREHAYFQSLLGAYALDITDDEETRELEGHLSICRECPQELAQLRAAANELPLLAEEMPPSAALRGRISAAARQERPDVRQINQGRPDPTNLPVSIRPGPRALPRWAPWLVAAVLLVGFVGMLGWNMRLRTNQGDGAIRTIALRSRGNAPVTGEVIYIPEQHLGVLKTEQLPALPAGQIYQMWLMKGDVPVGAGVFTSPTGEHAMSVDLRQYSAIAITMEPAPTGSEKPSSDPVAMAVLSGS